MGKPAQSEEIGAALYRERLELIRCRAAVVDPVHLDREPVAHQMPFDAAPGHDIAGLDLWFRADGDHVDARAGLCEADQIVQHAARFADGFQPSTACRTTGKVRSGGTRTMGVPEA